MTAGWLQTADVAVDDLNSQHLSSGGISGMHYHVMYTELNIGLTQARHVLYQLGERHPQLMLYAYISEYRHGKYLEGSLVNS